MQQWCYTNIPPLDCLDVTPASFETPEGRPGSPSSVLGKTKKGADSGKFLFTIVTENGTTHSTTQSEDTELLTMKTITLALKTM